MIRLLFAMLLVASPVVAQPVVSDTWTYKSAPAMNSPTLTANVITIMGCCSIGHDGKVTLQAGVTLDEASTRFWAAISQLGLQNCKPPQGVTP
jgi:hypothetical protein